MSDGRLRREQALEASLVGAIRDSAALDIAGDWAEIGLDGLIDSDLIEKIPVISHVRAAWKTGRQISELLFTRKLLRFFSHLGSVPEGERAAFVERLEEDPEQQSRVGEHLILLLDRADDLLKPHLFAVAFARYIRGVWTFSQFQEAARAIDHCLISDLNYFAAHVEYRPTAFDEMGGLFLQVDGESGGAAARLGGAGIVERAGGGYCLTLAGEWLRALLPATQGDE